MATINTVRATLEAIKNAPHAIKLDAIKQAVQSKTGAWHCTIQSVISKLMEEEYIKADSNGNGYFTRTPKRAAIQAFISGGNTLEGFSFDRKPTAGEANSILRKLRQAAHATGVDTRRVNGLSEVDIINFLSEKGITKQHKDHTGSFFVKKAKREQVDAFLAGDLTYAQLLGGVVAPTGLTAQVLRKLRQAAHAIGVWTYGGEQSEWAEAKRLVTKNIVKEHKDQQGAYFVRKASREAVDLYLEGRLSLEDLYAQAETAQMVLKAIRTAPHALELTASQQDLIMDLINAGVVKEHRDNEGTFFVKKTWRDDADAVIAGTMTISDLIEKAEAGEPTSEPTCEVATPATPAPAVMDSVDNLFDELESMRDRLDAILSANGR